LRSLRL